MNAYNIELDREKIDPLNIMLNNIKEHSRILEFGCANGRMTQCLSEEMHCKVDIVEYDKELFEMAFPYANDGVQGDILAFEWCKRFADRKYDYIIFADVLEHLRNPLRVLKECKKFLRENGIIWISVPNIAHNDIIINLIEGRFNYSETGLLDKTHVYFFTAQTAREMFEKAGFVIAYEDSICVKTFCSEQLLDKKPEWKEYYDELLRRNDGEVYQCVFALTLNEENSFEYSNNIFRDKVSATYERRVYIDCGDGFSSYPISYGNVKDDNLFIEIDLPSNAKMVWITPAFRKRFIIKNLKIEVDNQSIDYCHINAEKIGDEYWFKTLEGDIYVDKIDGCKKMIISGKIYFDIRSEKELYIQKIYLAEKIEKKLRLLLDKKEEEIKNHIDREKEILAFLEAKENDLSVELEGKEELLKILDEKNDTIARISKEKNDLQNLLEKTFKWKIKKRIEKLYLEVKDLKCLFR